MKKLIMFAACSMLAVVTHAAAVGWSLAGATNYKNDAYQFFVIGQNGADSIATITALLDAGTSTADYAFGSGNINASGLANKLPAASGKTLASGSYTGFYVVFDSATPEAGTSKYAVVSGASGLSVTIADTTANASFAAGSAASILNNASNWKSYGTSSSVPEPTSGLLMLLGVAGLALKRKRA